MKYEVRKYYKKPLLVNEKMIQEILEEIKRVCEFVSYESELENGDNVVFESLDELLKYENYYGERIVTLRFKGRSESFNDYVDIELKVREGVFKITSIADFYIKTSNADNKNLIKNNLSNIMEHHKQDKIYSFFSLTSFFNSLKWIIWFILLGTNILWITTKYDFGNIILIPSILTIIVFIFEVIYKKKRGKVFNPLVFYIGEEKELYDKRKASRSSFFWTVIVGGGLTVIATIVSIILSVLI